MESQHLLDRLGCAQSWCGDVSGTLAFGESVEGVRNVDVDWQTE